MRCAAMIRQTVLAILACALTTHDAEGQSVTSFDPPSGNVQVPATGPGAPAITIYNADPTEALLVDLPGLSSFLWVEVSAASGSCDADVSLPSSGPATVTVDADSTCILSAAVDPLAAPPPGQSVEEGVTLTAYGSAMLSGSYTLRATGSGGGGGPAPANDHFAAAEDLSGLVIPPFVAVPHPLFAGLVVPRDTVSVAGTTVGSTREPFEYGTVVNEDGSETPPPNGTVWFRYTSPPGGFAGRLGYRVSRGFFSTPLVQRPGAAEPMPDLRGTDGARGNSWPPYGRSFVRMEPGHSVWFQMVADVENGSGTPVWTDGPFTLELYQVPNDQDSILNAYSVTGEDNPDGTGRPWSDPFNWGGDGDTYHLTADQPGGPPNMWFTATFDRPGLWTFRACSEQATGAASTRPLGVRLYQAPSGQRVTDPSVLTFVQGTDGSLLNDDDRNPEPVWCSALVDVPVQPGRYYWSVDEGPDGPTFYSLNSTYRAVAAPPPPVVAFPLTDAGALREGDLHQIQITRTGNLASTSTVTFAIRGGTATTDDIGLVRGTDHVNGGFATLGTGFGTFSLTFNPGVDYVLLAVASAQDSVVEPDETFVVELLSATGATLGDPSLRLATGTILNDDVPPPTVAFAAANVGSTPEGTGVDGRLVVTLVRSGNLSAATTVRFEVAGGTVSADDVYVLGAAPVGPGTLAGSLGTYEVTFGPEAGVVEVEVFARGDSTVEADETVVLQLVAVTSNGSLSTTSPLTASGVFTNDDLPPPVNTPPVGVDDAVSTPYETPVVIAVLANDTDAENDPLGAGAFANLVGGTLSLPGDGTVLFTPGPGFTGTGGFTYRPYDGQAQGNVTTVTVTVGAPPPPPCATNVGGAITVTRGTIRYVRTRARFEQVLTLTNTGTAAIAGPLAVAVDGLPAHATVADADGVTACAAPLGSPFETVPVGSDGVLSAGETASIVVAFTTTQNQSFTYTTRVLAGTSR
jgi:hypothetical protein